MSGRVNVPRRGTRRAAAISVIHVDDITLRAFEKYRASEILQKYLQETFSGYFYDGARTLAKYTSRIHL